MRRFLQRAPALNSIRGDVNHERSRAVLRFSRLAARCAEIVAQIARQPDLNRLAALSEWCVEQTERLEQLGTAVASERFSVDNETGAEETEEPALANAHA